jgi:hypothetical protein
MARIRGALEDRIPSRKAGDSPAYLCPQLSSIANAYPANPREARNLKVCGRFGRGACSALSFLQAANLTKYTDGVV